MIVMKNQEAVYYTEIEPEIITLKSDKRYYVQGYISTIDKDLVNDVLTIEAQKDLHSQIQSVITKGGFITGDIEHMVFYDEKGNQLNFPKVRDEKGNLIIPELKFVQSELREKGVWVKAEVNKHLPNFKTIWKSIEDGFLNGFSVAVNALETVTKRVNNEMVNYISKLKLLNITMTGTPCNQNALMAPVLKSLIQKSEIMKDEFDKEELLKVANKEQLLAIEGLYNNSGSWDFIEYLKGKPLTVENIDLALAYVIVDYGLKNTCSELQSYETENNIVDKFYTLEFKDKTDEQKIEYFMLRAKGFSHTLAMEYINKKQEKNNIKTKNVLKTKGDGMDTEVYEKLTDEQKIAYDALTTDEDKDKFVKDLEASADSSADAETDSQATTDPKENVELKSAIVSLKSEIAKINTDNLALKTELKAVAERLEKIETQPIKKSLAADKSKMLGVTETSNLREISALDLI